MTVRTRMQAAGQVEPPAVQELRAWLEKQTLERVQEQRKGLASVQQRELVLQEVAAATLEEERAGPPARFS